MNRKYCVALAAATVIAAVRGHAWFDAARSQPGVDADRAMASVRILFGITDAAPSRWDGRVQIENGAVKAIQGVRFGAEDSTDYETKWSLTTRAQGNQVLENGVIISAAVSPDSRWRIQTAKGPFSFTLRDLRWGEARTFLDGAVSIEEVPPATQLTTSDDDEYAPAIAASPEGAWLAFARFAHSDRTREGVLNVGKPLDDFNDLVRPAGGDQVFAVSWDKAREIWSSPAPVSPKGEAIAGIAAAVDGEKRPWVFWSAMRGSASGDAGFHLFARRAAAAGGWDPEIRITSAAGPDMKPVAATDAHGRVWIAWQGYRNGNLEILAAMQNRDGFSPETIISFSPASDWDPSIAAAPDGDVAIAWDTYDHGDYDVYARRLRASATGIQMDAPIAVAATPDFEARASAAFDARGRLWIAYEISPAKWGGNFGPYDTSGSPLYEDRDIRVRSIDNGALETTSDDLVNVMPGPPGPARRRKTRPNRDPLEPAPGRSENRKPGQAIGPRNGSVNSSPRLAVDSAGGVYLAFRTISSPPGARSPAGSIWMENLAYFDGHEWTGPIFVPRSDGPLDSSPALLSPARGRLLAITAMDHRQSVPTGLSAERINSDLYVADFHPGIAPASTPEMVVIGNAAPHAAESQVSPEDVVRGYRIEISGQPALRILRGDFDRYTEYSIDGARDGSLEDAYRYMIDAARLDWGACCDSDNGNAHEFFWWLEQNAADAYHLADRFTPLYGYDRLVRYPEGHRTILFARRGVRPLPHLPPAAADAPPAPAPDTQMLYRYLRVLGGISIPHSTTTDLGTDWRDNDPVAEPAAGIYEGQRQSYEGEGAPRSPSQADAISGFHAAGFLSQALAKGYRFGFAAGSGHFSTRAAFTSVLAAANTREAILDAFRKRHIYASTAPIIADVRSGDHLMGDEFEGPASLSIRLIGTAPFSRVTVIKDGKEVYGTQPNAREVKLEWTDSAASAKSAAVYYVRAEQTDGNLVWTSPMWITPANAKKPAAD